jgi:hypothetical protein
MVVPNYTYLKLKMPGPNDIITVGGSFEQAYTCGREHFELATTVTNSAELKRLHEIVVVGVRDRNEPKSSTTFRLTEDTKAIEIDPNDPTKTVWIGTQLLAK